MRIHFQIDPTYYDLGFNQVTVVTALLGEESLPIRSNTFDFDIDYANAINYMDINGSSNTINFSGSGYGGTTSSDSGYFYLDLDGSSNTVNITQSSTLARDYLKILSNTSNSNICVVQNDGGTSTSC